MLVLNRLQSHQKQGRWNKFKSGSTNKLQAKQADKKFKLLYSLHTTLQIFSACLLTLAHWYF